MELSRGRRSGLLAVERKWVTFLNGAPSLPASTPERNGSRSCGGKKATRPGAGSGCQMPVLKKNQKQKQKKHLPPLFKEKRRRKEARGWEQSEEGEKSLAVGVCMHQHHNDESSWNRNRSGQ